MQYRIVSFVHQKGYPCLCRRPSLSLLLPLPLMSLIHLPCHGLPASHLSTWHIPYIPSRHLVTAPTPDIINIPCFNPVSNHPVRLSRNYIEMFRENKKTLIRLLEQKYENSAIFFDFSSILSVIYPKKRLKFSLYIHYFLVIFF